MKRYTMATTNSTLVAGKDAPHGYAFMHQHPDGAYIKVGDVTPLKVALMDLVKEIRNSGTRAFDIEYAEKVLKEFGS